MATDTANHFPAQSEPVLRNCVATLSRVANYHLPNALDQRLLWLSENKENLDIAQREELAALVDLADHRALDKVQAQAVLDQLTKIYPELSSASS
ncbi:MAG: hypothetical protein WD669_04505 [Pirellulales bacterium]